jgi:hypothetical protein
MSGVISIALKHLIAAGASEEALVLAVAEMEAAVVSIVDESAERRREIDRIRSRLNREAAIAHLTKDDDWNCAYCDCELSYGDIHIDHIVPLSKGGTNDIENLALSCKPCNLRKGARTPEEWRATCQ